MTVKCCVSEGDFIGKEVVLNFGSLLIMNGVFSRVEISKKTVDEVEILSRELSEKKEKIYFISILFKTKQKCVILADDKVYNKIISLFPEVENNRLEELLMEGWKIIGYSTALMGSGMTSGIIKASIGLNEKHYILLQKDTKVKTYCVVVNGNGEEIGHSELILS